MEYHLKQMRDKKSSDAAMMDQQRKQQLEYLQHVSQQDAQDKQRKEESRKVINDDFVDSNRHLMDRGKKIKQLQ